MWLGGRSLRKILIAFITMVMTFCILQNQYQGTTTKTLDTYNAVSTQTVKLPSVSIRLAQQYYLEGGKAFNEKNYAEAVSLEDKALGLNKLFYQAYNEKGIALCYASNNSYAQAMYNIDKSLDIDPNYGYARFDKALCEERYGYYDAAIESYLSALKISSRDWWVPWSYYGIASIYGRRGDVQNTVKYLKTAIHLDPSIKRNAQNESDFNNVRSSDLFQETIK